MDISKIVDSSHPRAVTSVARIARDAEQAVRRSSFKDLTELNSIQSIARAALFDARDYARDLARLSGAFSAAEVAALARGDQWSSYVQDALDGAREAQQVARQAEDLLRISGYHSLGDSPFASWHDAYNRIAGLTDTLGSLHRQLDTLMEPSWFQSAVTQAREAWDAQQRLFDLVYPESLQQAILGHDWRDELLDRWAEALDVGVDDEETDNDIDAEADAPSFALDPASVFDAATESAPRREAGYAMGLAVATAQLAAVAQRLDPLSTQGDRATAEWTITIAAHVPHLAHRLCATVHEIQQRTTLFFAAPGNTTAGREAWMAEDDVAFDDAVKALDGLLREIGDELDQRGG